MDVAYALDEVLRQKDLEAARKIISDPRVNIATTFKEAVGINKELIKFLLNEIGDESQAIDILGELEHSAKFFFDDLILCYDLLASRFPRSREYIIQFENHILKFLNGLPKISDKQLLLLWLTRHPCFPVRFPDRRLSAEWKFIISQSLSKFEGPLLLSIFGCWQRFVERVDLSDVAESKYFIESDSNDVFVRAAFLTLNEDIFKKLPNLIQESPEVLSFMQRKLCFYFNYASDYQGYVKAVSEILGPTSNALATLCLIRTKKNVDAIVAHGISNKDSHALLTAVQMDRFNLNHANCIYNHLYGNFAFDDIFSVISRRSSLVDLFQLPYRKEGSALIYLLRLHSHNISFMNMQIASFFSKSKCMHVVDALKAIDDITEQMKRITELHAHLPAGVHHLLRVIPARINYADRLCYFAASLIGTMWEDVLKETFLNLSSAVRREVFLEAIRMQNPGVTYYVATFLCKQDKPPKF